jgi:hypothetical protein
MNHLRHIVKYTLEAVDILSHYCMFFLSDSSNLRSR